MSQLRTFEILAKYIGKASNVKVRLEKDAVPHAYPETREIVLPYNIAEDRVYPAIAECIHEACHIRYTTFKVKDVIDDDYEMHILNAIEDIRIDKKAFGILPNIPGFYEDLYADIKKRQPPPAERKKMAFEGRVLVDIICDQEGFGHYKSGDKEVEEFIADYGISHKVYEARDALDNGDLKKARKKVKEIADAFDIDRKKPKPKDPNAQGGGGARPAAQQVADAMKAIGKDASKIWGHTSDVSSAPFMVLDPLALREQTQKQFEELLKMKEEQIFIHEEGGLNTENLTSFFTEDIEELFVDSRIIEPKKSKIIIVLDASGSMSSSLLCGTSAKDAVAKTAGSIKEVIDRVNEAEGLCVDYEIAAFNENYIKLDKENWMKQYNQHTGGTCVINAFKQAQKDLLSDFDIEGNKMIVFLTDGQVDSTEIDQVRAEIIKTNSEIKVLILGVGADPHGSFVQNIIEDANIMDLESADVILLEAIMGALGS